MEGMTLEKFFYVSGMTWGDLSVFLFIIAAWSLTWKGIALWKAAKLNQRGWFIALVIVNTVGILDILYIYIFSKKEELKQSEQNR